MQTPKRKKERPKNIARQTVPRIAKTRRLSQARAHGETSRDVLARRIRGASTFFLEPHVEAAIDRSVYETLKWGMRNDYSFTSEQALMREPMIIVDLPLTSDEVLLHTRRLFVESRA